MALKDRDEGIGAVFGQVLNFPGTCHPDHFPRDKYEYYSPEQNNDGPIITTEAVHWFWSKLDVLVNEYDGRREFANVFITGLYYPEAGDDPYASPLLANSHKDLAPACKFTLVKSIKEHR